MPNQPPPSPISPADSLNLQQAFKEFSLETERLEMTYRSLQERFKSVQTTLQESHTRLSGKLVELDFMSKYLGALLNHISQGIIFIDQKGIVTTYNATAQELLQIDEKKLLFHPFSEYFDDRFLGFSLQEAFTAKQCPKTTFITLARNGQTVELEVEASFVSMGPQAYSMAQPQMPSLAIQGLLVLMRDVTKIRHLQQIAARNDRLKELGALASHLAHEIRNPLGGIKGFATLLHQELKDRPDLQQMAAHIEEGADGLNHFVSGMLHYSRPFQPHFEMVDLVPFVDEIRQLMQADSAWNRAIEFSIRCPVPTLIAPIDPQLFKSALLNLFVNAVQAMPDGGVLTVDIDAEDNGIVIRVRDTGSGIAQENLNRIFSPFFTTKQTGNGLGLAEVHKVVQAHSGSIEVQSEIGQGTVFVIKISKTGES